MATTITDATGVDAADLCAAMSAAFSDYAIPLALTQSAFDGMMRQRGLSPAASRIARIDDRIAAIWLVSVRGNASYLISSGTIPAYRGQGLATRLAHSALDGLRQHKIATFQTEVLVKNTTAAGLYYKLGMKKHRDLSCYTITGAGADARAELTVTESPWRDIASATETLRDWPPSWQNSNASVDAAGPDIRCFCTHDNATLTGYAVLAPGAGTVMQIGVHPDARRRGIGTALLNHVRAATPNGQLRLINADAADAGFAAFMHALGANQTQGQFELLMPL